MDWPCAALSDADLADRTTMRVGGRAEWLLEPADPEELVRAWVAARERGFRPRVLGGGANLIVADGRLPGVVVTTARMRRVFRPGADEGEGPERDVAALARSAPAERDRDPRLVAWAGATMPSVVRAAQELGWSGLEGLVGVPGSIGGGVAMNAGGRPGCVWDAVASVRLLSPDGDVRDRGRAECTPGYRDGGLGDALCLGVVLRFRVDRPDAVRARMKEFLRQKRGAQPVTEWSAGCIFRNPDPEASDGRSAGRLIEDCGGKELARGDAVVSPKHANFIVNRGGATAADVLGLVEDVRARVRERSGVDLVREVRVWSESDG